MQRAIEKRDQLAARAQRRYKNFIEDCRWDHIFFSPKVKEQAMFIQKVTRGWLARKLLQGMREEEVHKAEREREWEKQLNIAASRMQHVLRKHHVRKTAQYSRNPLLVIAAAIRVQRWVRRFIAERMRLRLLRQLVVAQGAYRRWEARKVVDGMRMQAALLAERASCATRLQAVHRSMHGRRVAQMKRELRAIVAIQAALRKRGALHVFRAKREERASIRIQKRVRAALARAQFGKMVAMVKSIDLTLDPQKFVVEFKCQDAKHSTVRVSISGALAQQRQQQEALMQQHHPAFFGASQPQHRFLGAAGRGDTQLRPHQYLS
jgi:hypothetical protein